MKYNYCNISPLLLLLLPTLCAAFTNTVPHHIQSNNKQLQRAFHYDNNNAAAAVSLISSSSSSLKAAPVDLDVVSLVNEQYNYALAVVCLGEGVWSFIQSPSLSHAKILIAPIISAVILVLVSGPLLAASSSAGDVSLGLEINTFLSIALGVNYVLRLVAPFSPSAKEAAFLGLLVSIAGVWSFSQNLVVNEFITLPSLPTINLPSIELPTFDFSI